MKVKVSMNKGEYTIVKVENALNMLGIHVNQKEVLKILMKEDTIINGHNITLNLEEELFISPKTEHFKGGCFK